MKFFETVKCARNSLKAVKFFEAHKCEELQECWDYEQVVRNLLRPRKNCNENTRKRNSTWEIADNCQERSECNKNKWEFCREKQENHRKEKEISAQRRI